MPLSIIVITYAEEKLKSKGNEPPRGMDEDPCNSARNLMSPKA